jgi:hypothetical protein
MNNFNTYLIHEFSVGIQYASAPPPYNWMMRGGFTGSYMNCTFPENFYFDPYNDKPLQIPNNIQRAISNDLFTASPHGFNQEPVIIGRDIPAQGSDPAYSVIAFTTSGLAEGNSTFRAVRYFACEWEQGKNVSSLPKILEYINRYRETHLRYPSFNPLESQRVNQPHELLAYQPPDLSLPDDWKKFIEQPNIPLTINAQSHQYDLLTIHRASLFKAKKINCDIAWAYNAGFLNHPQQFVVIHTINPNLYKVAQPTSANQRNSSSGSSSSASAGTMPVTYDRARVKSAIQNLTSRSNIKPEFVLVIAEYIDQEVNWEEAFNAEGINETMKDQRTARFLTLKAILIPKFLPKSLKWLKENEQFLEVSLTLQKEFIKNFPQDQDTKNKGLNQKLSLGVHYAVKSLLGNNQPIIDPDTFLLLFKSKIWSNTVNSFLKNISKDLTKVSDYKNSYSSTIPKQQVQNTY